MGGLIFMNDKLFIIGVALLIACLLAGAVYGSVSMKHPGYTAYEAVKCPNCGNSQDLDHWGCGSIAAPDNWQCPKCGCYFGHSDTAV